MRVRSAAIVLGMSGLLAGSLVRCNLPELPPGPQALPTRIGLPGGAFLSLKGAAPVDRASLVASLKELKLKTVIIQASADPTGEVVNDRVALAIDLQRELDTDVFIGTYQAAGRSGQSMVALLQTDAAFAACYPGGLPLGADLSVIDKIRLCSQDVSKKIAAALGAANANAEHIGCYISHGPPLTDDLTNLGRTKLEEFYRDSASACHEAKRFVGVSPVLTASAGEPDHTGMVLREVLRDSVDVVMLQDGVGSFDALHPKRAARYYQGLRNALADRVPRVLVWANLEAFECESADCVKTHPTSTKRFTEQLCAAAGRVDGIVVYEYFNDLGRGLQDAGSADAEGGLEDTDASAQLRAGLIDLDDAGLRCQ